MKIIMKKIRLIFLIWIIYALVSGVVIFVKAKEISGDYVEASSVKDYYSNQTGPDRGILIDNPLESGLARLKIIDNAKESLDIAYFSIESGQTPHLFFGALIDAADRGVEVNILLDGIFHGLKGELKTMISILNKHPRMNLKFYEPLNPLKPWTFNNRMHDKYIISDQQLAIIGGRNIGDKYFAPEWYHDKITNDRDIIVFNSQPEDSSSVIHQMSSYFDEVWNHDLSEPRKSRLSRKKSRALAEKSKELRGKFDKAKELNDDFFNEPLDLMELSFPIEKASFIHNPIGRFSKEPWCWYEISQLLQSAEESIFIQSPYIIPHRSMVEGFLDGGNFEDIQVTALTNSMASTPNLPAYAGYINHRKNLVDQGLNIYEYQSTDSLHTKAFIIDEDLLAIGSFNSDPRSAYLNTESMVIIHSREAVKEIEAGLGDYLDHSLLVISDYEYMSKPNTPAGTVKLGKKIATYGLSYIVRWLEFLL